MGNNTNNELWASPEVTQHVHVEGKHGVDMLLSRSAHKEPEVQQESEETETRECGYETPVEEK